MLRINNLAHSEGSYKLKLRIEGNPAYPPSLSTQEHLLEPFRCMSVSEPGLQINGAVDASYARSLRRSMCSFVRWVRDEKWQVYDLCVSIKEVAGTCPWA